MSINAFSEHFADLQDPRQTTKVAYSLFDILFLTVCAVVGGAEGWQDIEDFGEAHLHGFRSEGFSPQDCPLTIRLPE